MARRAHFRDELTVIVLGAGASRGEVLVNEGQSQPVCLPPLNADFFTQLQRIDHDKHSDTINSVLRDINTFFGSNWTLTLEEYFTQIEFFTKSLKYDRKLNTKFYERLSSARKNLFQALSAVLEEAIPGDSHPYHSSIVEMLQRGDAIFSFNYDTLIDLALKNKGSEKWNPEKGYGFPLKSKCKIIGAEHWKPSNPSSPDSIKLLKLHGSVHWKIKDDNSEIELKQRTHKQYQKPQFSIIPPEWNKSEKDSPIYKRLWSLATEALSKASNIVLVGYSFSNNDLHSLALFRLAVRNPLKRIVIVNPNQDARRRTRSALQGGIRESTIISQFDSFQDFCNSGIYEVLKTGKLKSAKKNKKKKDGKLDLQHHVPNHQQAI